MAETQLKDLLGDFDNALPNSIQRSELVKRHSEELVEMSTRNGIIYMIRSGEMSLSESGLGLLLQLRTKKAIDQLNNSIKKFDESSNKLSKRLLYLTIVYTIMTAILVIKEFLPK